MATVTECLRRELEQCGQTRYAVSMATGISQAVLSRFVHGQPLSGPNFDTLADYLNLVLVAKPGKATKGK